MLTAANQTAGSTDEKNSPLSQRLWGIDWRQHLPCELRGFQIVASSYEQATPFIARHYPVI